MAFSTTSLPAIGSSPQARGTPYNSETRLRLHRFIPAGAGNTVLGTRNRIEPSVHPRRRGEHRSRSAVATTSGGSSPQARGTQSDADIRSDSSRFIPAGAGNTTPSAPHRNSLPVHPRRRGEHCGRSPVQLRPNGSSPQARGTHTPGRLHTPGQRFIPAGAGNTPVSVSVPSAAPVHPRRRGEHSYAAERLSTTPRFIPAGAGNTSARVNIVPTETVHPRRRGEHLAVCSLWMYVIGSSPQARGTLLQRRRERIYGRFIPAGAGNTEVRVSGGCRGAVHPRRRGEHSLVRT